MALIILVSMKAWAGLLAVLVVLSILSFAQTAQSQQYTTATVTSLLTGTQPSTVAVGTETMTMTAVQSSPIFSAPVTIPGTHGVCGIYFQQAFNASAGQTLTGNLTASTKVDLYVMTQSAFQAWSHQVVAGGTCTPASPVLSQLDTTSYNFTTPLPSGGRYQIVVNNLSQSTVTAHLTASLSTTQPALTTTIIYSTTMLEIIQTIMQNSTGTIQSSSGSTSDTLPMAAGIIIIIIIGVAAYFMKSRRSPKK